ncbi:jerky protein homolog-like [Macrobrachium nipponense]|uniref:jerky protein homolog-like n=1 Tax=Macrobrachium nipponense TaxID=159736 RepID=UPI0030C86E42
MNSRKLKCDRSPSPRMLCIEGKSMKLPILFADARASKNSLEGKTCLTTLVKASRAHKCSIWTRLASLEKDAFTYLHHEGRNQSLWLQVYGNAAAFTLKPGVIYKFAKPKALKNKTMHTLPVFFMHNFKVWITKVLTDCWFHQSFIPQVKDYLNNLCLEFKVLLVMDNAGDHPVNIYYEGVQIEFFPVNTTSLLKAMDQGMIHAFKALYTWNSLDHLVVKTMDDNSEFTLKSVLAQIHDRHLFDCHQPIIERYEERNPKFLLEEVVARDCVIKAFLLKKFSILPLTIWSNRQRSLVEGFDDITVDEIGTLIDAHSESMMDQDLEEMTNSVIEDEGSAGSGDKEEEEDEGLTLDFLSSFIYQVIQGGKGDYSGMGSLHKTCLKVQ